MCLPKQQLSAKLVHLTSNVFLINITTGVQHNLFLKYIMLDFCQITVILLSFGTDTSVQTVQTQIRLLLEEQSDQGLHYLLIHLYLFDEILFV